MYPGHWSQTKPANPAITNVATGESLTWRELDQRSNQVAQWLHGLGLRDGDHVALLMDNRLEFFEIAWAALRSGLYITCINQYLQPEEVAYIVEDSTSSVLFTASSLETIAALPELLTACPHRVCIDAPDGYQDYATVVAEQPTTALTREPVGDSMLYSSGTTGRPKGIKRPLLHRSVRDGIPGVERANAYAIDEDTRYLSPAPLYHAAPFGFCMRTLSLGGSVYFMPRFDAERALEHIEQYRITHSQWVPTMFVRMLKLDAQVRSRYDLSSHRCAIHAAAPCPVEVKQRMMSWWGPIVWEYYAGTERNGSTLIGPEEWLAHPGSVGRARNATIHICDETGAELGTGQAGMIYFEQPQRNFEYHNAPDKTSDATHPQHANWSTLGDVGYLDEEGYLYLTDRKAFMIISGGVNIYPQEIEDVLILHDKVADVAVFGVPNAEFGEEVKAVVQPSDGIAADVELADELMAFTRAKIAAYKVPRSIDFIDAIPRLPTGKLYKRHLKERYWP